MAKIRKPVCRICKKYSEKLYLKGRRCETAKCPVDVRKNRTARGRRFRKTSEYGVQLKEKNKVKIYYGVLERQFRRYFEMARAGKGITGELLLQVLERRLDNVVYRLTWAFSRRMARQMISHRSILVNGRTVDRPGYLVKIGDVITLKPTSPYKELVEESRETRKSSPPPAWIEVTPEGLEAKITRYNTRDEVTIPVSEQYIVNLYSK